VVGRGGQEWGGYGGRTCTGVVEVGGGAGTEAALIRGWWRGRETVGRVTLPEEGQVEPTSRRMTVVFGSREGRIDGEPFGEVAVETLVTVLLGNPLGMGCSQLTNDLRS